MAILKVSRVPKKEKSSDASKSGASQEMPSVLSPTLRSPLGRFLSIGSLPAEGKRQSYITKRIDLPTTKSRRSSVSSALDNFIPSTPPPSHKMRNSIFRQGSRKKISKPTDLAKNFASLDDEDMSYAENGNGTKKSGSRTKQTTTKSFRSTHVPQFDVALEAAISSSSFDSGFLPLMPRSNSVKSLGKRKELIRANSVRSELIVTRRLKNSGVTTDGKGKKKKKKKNKRQTRDKSLKPTKTTKPKRSMSLPVGDHLRTQGEAMQLLEWEEEHKSSIQGKNEPNSQASPEGVMVEPPADMVLGESSHPQLFISPVSRRVTMDEALLYTNTIEQKQCKRLQGSQGSFAMSNATASTHPETVTEDSIMNLSLNLGSFTTPPQECNLVFVHTPTSHLSEILASPKFPKSGTPMKSPSKLLLTCSPKPKLPTRLRHSLRDKSTSNIMPPALAPLDDDEDERQAIQSPKKAPQHSPSPLSQKLSRPPRPTKNGPPTLKKDLSLKSLVNQAMELHDANQGSLLSIRSDTSLMSRNNGSSRSAQSDTAEAVNAWYVPPTPPCSPNVVKTGASSLFRCRQQQQRRHSEIATKLRNSSGNRNSVVGGNASDASLRLADIMEL